MTKPIASLIPVRIEVKIRGYVNPKTGNVGPARFVWRDGYQVKTPDGILVYPYMKKREAREYCKEAGWQVIVGGALGDEG